MSEIDVCKYKFQNAEKFNGKAYCTCLNKLCEDIAFVCEDNCQIYEDYKQLQAKEQECKKLQFTLKHVGLLDLMNENNELKQEYNTLEKRVQAEIHLRNKYVNLFKKAREIYLRTSKGNLRLISENEDLKDTIKRFTCQAECYKHKEAERFKQALDEIEKFMIYEFSGQNQWVKKNVLDIINKAKEKTNEKYN